MADLDQPQPNFWTLVKRGVRDAQREASSRLHQVVNTETIRLAVTGLSRAGKTVFITSAAQNLLAMADGKGSLPKFDDHGISARLLKMGLAPPSPDVPVFPFERNFAALTEAIPVWPPRTASLASVALRFIVKRRMTAGLQFLKQREVTVEILDYPGEWLLDLPMMAQGFAQWSNETLKRMWQGLRAEPAKPYLEYIKTLDLDAPLDADKARRAHDLYLAYLFDARDRLGLRFLQPGGFLCNPPWPKTDAMVFGPLPIAPGGRLKPGSYADVFQKRFDQYRTEMGQRFFARHFQRFDRQIVLVDVLGALNGGKDVFDDTREAISALAACYDYGRASLFNPFARGIAKVMFAATKADHVPERKRDNLRHLLSGMAGNDIDDMRSARTHVRTAALAAVRCTADAVIKVDGRDSAVVRGLPMDATKQVYVDAGEVPVSPPGDDFWTGSYFDLPVFRPPKLDASGRSGVPHLGLDSALYYLLGDRL